MYKFIAIFLGVLGFFQYHDYAKGKPHTFAGVVILFSLCGLCAILGAFEHDGD